MANNTILITFRYSFASIILAELHARARERSLIVKKISESIYPTKFGNNVSVRPNASRIVFRGGGGESGISPSGEKYVIAEVKFLHFKHPARFAGKSHGRPDF